MSCYHDNSLLKIKIIKDLNLVFSKLAYFKENL